MQEERIDLAMLEETACAGGPSALSDVTRLGLAGGPSSLVAPAKYTEGKNPTYCFSIREYDGVPTNVVLIDSRTSEANRLEAALCQAIREGHDILSRMPVIRVVYRESKPDELVETDLQLPHRAFDAHIRLGFDAESPETSILQNAKYLAARNSTPASAGGLFEISPISVLLGCWDSTRRVNQARFASCLTGEIIGILSDQDSLPKDTVMHRSGARIDPVAASITFSKADDARIRERVGQAAKKGSDKASSFVIGAIPPGVGPDALDGISVREIIRSRVLSLSTLRALCFGKGIEGDKAIRALLAAIAINAMSRADADLNLRANAHLVENEAPNLVLYKRFGERVVLVPPTIEESDKLLSEAYEKASSVAGVDWHGQTLNVIGEPAVLSNADDTADGE